MLLYITWWEVRATLGKNRVNQSVQEGQNWLELQDFRQVKRWLQQEYLEEDESSFDPPSDEFPLMGETAEKQPKRKEKKYSNSVSV